MPIYESKLVNLIFGDFLMKKFILGLIAIGLLSSVGYAKNVEQTILLVPTLYVGMQTNYINKTHLHKMN